MAAFEEYGVIPELADALTTLNWSLPTAVQSEAIPAILGGADALIAAETGSGKTGAFCLPIAQIVWEKRREAMRPSDSMDVDQNSWTLNLLDRNPSLFVNGSGLGCESKVQKEWNGVRANGGLHGRGKYYYEVTIKKDGLCRVGWSTLTGSLQIGTDHESYGYGGTGMKSFGKNFARYGQSFTTNDVLGCFLDLDNLAVWWSKNGEEFQPGYTINAKFAHSSSCLYPAVVLQNSELHINFGDLPFKYPPKTPGFVGVSHAKAENVAWFSNEGKNQADMSKPLCIILEPTRELVQQTYRNMQIFADVLKEPSIRCISLAAGESMPNIIKTLNDGCDIIVGTPSRIVDLIQTSKLSVHSLQFIVIDEIDQFLTGQNGGGRQVENVFKTLPLHSASGSRRQVIACSATLHNFEVEKFAARYMSFPQWIDLKGTDCVSNDVHHVVCNVDAWEDKQWIRMMHDPNHLKDDMVHSTDSIRPGTQDKSTLSLGTKILKGIYVLKAIRAMNMDKAIVFCRTKQQCDQMEEYLMANQLSAACLHSDRSPEEREASLQGFKNDTVRFLICTDVVARGLDVQGVPFVINVTLPDDKLMYVHRIGRVGRAERMGLSISLVSKYDEKVWYHKCRTRGVGCTNAKEVEKGGCCIWYQETKLLAEIEEHLGSTISTVDSDFNVPVDEFDGKVVYGEKRSGGSTISGHVLSLATSAAQLADLETRMQLEYLKNIQHVFAVKT